MGWVVTFCLVVSRIRCNLRVFWSFFVHPGSDLCMQHTRMCFKLIHRPRRNGYRRQPKLFVYPITMTPTEKLTGLLLWRTKRLVIVCLLSWTQFLLTLSPHHSKVLINSTITANMTFTKTSPKFGQWSDHRANTVFGLGFSSEKDLIQVTLPPTHVTHLNMLQIVSIHNTSQVSPFVFNAAVSAGGVWYTIFLKANSHCWCL